MDSIVDSQEADKILDLAKKGFAKGGGNGGASILDLHSGAFSKVCISAFHRSTRCLILLSILIVHINITRFLFVHSGRRVCKHLQVISLSLIHISEPTRPY